MTEKEWKLTHSDLKTISLLIHNLALNGNFVHMLQIGYHPKLKKIWDIPIEEDIEHHLKRVLRLIKRNPHYYISKNPYKMDKV